MDFPHNVGARHDVQLCDDLQFPAEDEPRLWNPVLNEPGIWACKKHDVLEWALHVLCDVFVDRDFFINTVPDDGL